MLSSRSSQRLSFADIKAMLKAHINVLLLHAKMVREIEAGNISDEDIREYLHELFDFTVSDLAQFKLESLPALKSAIDMKCKIYLNFSQIANHQHEEVAFSALYLSLQSELYYANLDKKMASKKISHFTDTMSTVLHAFDYLKSMEKSMKEILPDSFEELSQYILFHEMKEKLGRHRGERRPRAFASYSFRWFDLRDSLLSVVKKTANPRTGQPDKKRLESAYKDTPSEIDALDGWQDLLEQTLKKKGCTYTAGHFDLEEILSDVDAIFEKVNQQIHLNSSQLYNLQGDDTTMIADIYRNLVGNVELFYDVYPKFKRVTGLINYFVGEHEIKSKLRESVAQAKNDYQRAFQKLSTAYHLQVKQYNDVKDIVDRLLGIQLDAAFSRLLPVLSRSIILLQSELNKSKLLTEQLQGPFVVTIDATYTNALVREFDQVKKIVTALLQKLDKQVAECQRYQAQYVAPVSLLATEQVTISRQSHLQEQDDKVRAALLAEQAEKDKSYRERIIQERERRLQAGKLVQVAETPLIAQQSQMRLFENVDIKERLLQMNNELFGILLSLFKLEKGVKYKQVCHLISALDGEIQEVGSSHKRIRLAKVYVEVTIHDDEEHDDLTEVERRPATGGFFRQHGKARGCGKMIAFNMQLVVQAFKSAGYTEHLLACVEQERSRVRLLEN